MNRMSYIGVFLAIILIAALPLVGYLIESVDADEVMVIQHPTNGTLTWYTDPGIKWQGFGKVTTYRKMSASDFDSMVMFNDNGTGHLRGKYQVQLPLSHGALTSLHTKYGSQHAIERNLVQPTIDKVVYMTGPLMSSKESSAERKTDLIRYIVDQISHGVYRTTQKSVMIDDPTSKEKRTITVAEIVMKDGKPDRQEDSALNEFGIQVVNFAPSELEYDKEVKEQISSQQKITMQVQTARAQAIEAEQRRITAQADGEANVMKSRYEKEQEKIKAVVTGQKELEVAVLKAKEELEVASLKAKAAEQTKRQQILLGEGEAERKKLVMNADGALQTKLEVYERVNAKYADAIGSYAGNWMPQIVFGGDGKSHPNGAGDLISLFTAKAAKDLSLDMHVGGLNNTKGKGKQE